MDRIIEVKITGCHLTKSSNLAGVTGEANVTVLRIEFDDSWDGYAKTITWLNASGETATGFILTADMLDDIIKSTRVYIAPIPKAALTLAGETLFSVDGYMNGKRQRSVYGKLIVRQGGEFEAIDDVDATTAEQIQLQLEGHLEEIQAALTGAEQARDKSVESAEAAQASMASAQLAEENAQKASNKSYEYAAYADKSMGVAQASAIEAEHTALHVASMADEVNGYKNEALEYRNQTEEIFKENSDLEKLENKGVPNGYVPLNEEGQIPKKYVEYLCDNPDWNQNDESKANYILNKPDVYTKAEIDDQIYNIKVYKELFIAVYGETPVEDIFKAALAGMTVKLKVPNNREDCNTGVLIHNDYFYLDVAQAFLCGYDAYGEVTNTITFAGIAYSDLGKPLLVTAECYAYTFRDSVKHGWSYLVDTDIVTTNYTTYGVLIDLSNSNPETAVTYTDDAVGMVGGSSDWYTRPIFRDIKPCLFKNGAVVGYLNPNNFAQFEDGSDADITSGDSGDVMIEIPKIGYKISKIGTTLTVQITDDPNKDGFSYKAHTREREGDREKLYIGAFLGSNKANKLRSISGVAPQNNTTLTDFRIQAKANGAGYDLFAFYPMTLLQCLYLIIYKDLDSQSALGQGCVGNVGDIKNTGSTTYLGMNYGNIYGAYEQMKLLGIEDFWGNVLQWIDGLISTNDSRVLVATDNFNDTGDGYIDIGAIPRTYGFMTEPQGSNDAGFIIGKSGGSYTTYFSDYADFLEGRVPVFGGYSNFGRSAGAFMLAISKVSNQAASNIGARLMYL